jgi:hypothetical protein
VRLLRVFAGTRSRPVQPLAIFTLKSAQIAIHITPASRNWLIQRAVSNGTTENMQRKLYQQKRQQPLRRRNHCQVFYADAKSNGMYALYIPFFIFNQQDFSLGLFHCRNGK